MRGPLALAINNSCIATTAAGVISTPARLAPCSIARLLHVATRRMNLAAVISDTTIRARDLPRRKADIQKLNLDRNGDTYLLDSSMSPDIDLIAEYGAFTGFGTSTSLDRMRQEVSAAALATTRASWAGSFYVDRETIPKQEQGGAVPLLPRAARRVRGQMVHWRPRSLAQLHFRRRIPHYRHRSAASCRPA